MVTTDNALVVQSKADIQRLAENYPAECRPVFDELEKSRGEVLRQLSAQLPNALNVAQASSLADAYKTVDNVVLQQGKDGLFSATLRNENGEIVEHVKLKNASSSFAMAASFGYSVLNAAVGQANMMSIAERLAAIETKLDDAKKRDYVGMISSVESACKGMHEALTLKDEDHQRQTILERRNDLRTALDTLRGYMQIELEAMPEYRKRGFWEELFADWGGKKSTRPEVAREHFNYIARTLPVWCRGMSQLVLTDPCVEDNKCSSADLFVSDLKKLLVESRLQDRVKYVPMLGAVDPIRVVDDFVGRIPETERVFARMRQEQDDLKLSLTFKMEEIQNG